MHKCKLILIEDCSWSKSGANTVTIFTCYWPAHQFPGISFWWNVMLGKEGRQIHVDVACLIKLVFNKEYSNIIDGRPHLRIDGCPHHSTTNGNPPNLVQC